MTQEQANRINRLRDLRDEGGEPSLEVDRFRVMLDESGRPVEVHDFEVKRNAGHQ